MIMVHVKNVIILVSLVMVLHNNIVLLADLMSLEHFKIKHVDAIRSGDFSNYAIHQVKIVILQYAILILTSS